MTIKTFESFSSADNYVKSILSKFELKYEEGVYDDDGNRCIKVYIPQSESVTLYNDIILYIFVSHPNKENAVYHLKLLVNGQIEEDFSTTDIEGTISSLMKIEE
jgi:hypothetical protein